MGDTNKLTKEQAEKIADSLLAMEPRCALAEAAKHLKDIDWHSGGDECNSSRSGFDTDFFHQPGHPLWIGYFK